MDRGTMMNDLTDHRETDIGGTSGDKSMFARAIEEIELSLTEEISKLQQDLDLQTDATEIEEQNSTEPLDQAQHKNLGDDIKEVQEDGKNVTSSLLQEISQLKELRSLQCPPVIEGLADQRETREALPGINIHEKDSGMERDQSKSPQCMNSGRCILGKSAECDNKQLLLLPCLHAVCKPCVDQHNHTIITCKCGREVKLNEDKLPTDFVNVNETLLAKIRNQCGYLKAPCYQPVVSYCTDCMVSMCSNCQNDHGKIKVMSSHEVIPIDTFENSPPEKQLKASTCTSHLQQRLLYLDKNCGKALCDKCLAEDHTDHEVTALKSEYLERKEDLSKSLEQYNRRLGEIRRNMDHRRNRLSELQQIHNQLERQIVQTHEIIAVKVLHRLKDLLKDMNVKSGELQEMVREDIKIFVEKEASFLTTMAYANRCIESTTQAEFLELYDVISRKIYGDLEHPVPKDGTQGKHIVFSSRGQKAIEELVEMYGDIRCSENSEAREDDIPTLLEFQEECNTLQTEKKELTDLLTVKENEIEREKQVGASIHGKLQVLEQTVTHLQESICNIGLDPEGTPIPLVTTAVKLSQILQCVHLKYDHERVNLRKTHINNDGYLVNTPETRPRMRGYRRFQNFCGTTSTIPIRKAGGPQYLEVFARINIDKLLFENVLLLNIGLCRKKDRDASHYIPARPHCYSLEVGMCNKHGGVCTRIWKDGKTVNHHSNTVPNIEKTETSLRYGIVFDSIHGKVVFIDAEGFKVVSVLDNVDFNDSLWPMFGLYKLDGLNVEMIIVNGENLIMGDEMKALILKALM